MEPAPIVLFTYNRPHYLLETLNALQANAEFGNSKLIIYCDGPRPDCSSNGLKKIQEVRTLVQSVSGCSKLEVIVSDVNKGLATSIREGVTEVVNKYGRIIVLEDDLVVSPYFLRYMNEALDKYVNKDRVIAISGYNYPIKADKSFPETFFLRSIESLGWATWKRGWDLYIHDTQVLLDRLKEKKNRFQFDFNGNYPFYRMLVKADLGKIDSWAIRWYATAYINNKLSLLPTASLVRHIGNEGSNIKADNTDLIGWDIKKEPIVYFENNVVENAYLRGLISSHFRKYNRRRLSLNSFKYAYKRIILYNFKKVFFAFKNSSQANIY